MRAKSGFGAEFMEFQGPRMQEREKGYGYPRAESMIDSAIAWLEANRDRDYLLYLHLMDTHFPHSFGEDARRFLPEPKHDPTRFSRDGRPRRRLEPLSDRHVLA